MARGRRELEAFAARWLGEHPEPGRGVNNSVGEVDKLAEDIAALVGDAGVVVEAPAGPVVIVGEPETVATFVYEVERPHAEPCFAVAERVCDALDGCLACPAYAAWRKVVRSPYEVLR